MPVARRKPDAGQTKHELALDGGLGFIVGNYRGFEGLVIFGIFERSNDSLGRRGVRHYSANAVCLLQLSVLYFSARCAGSRKICGRGRGGACASRLAAGSPVRGGSPRNHSGLEIGTSDHELFVRRR